MNRSLCLIYLFIGIYFLKTLIKKNKKNKIIGCYSGIACGIILYYCIIPIVTIIFSNELSIQYVDIKSFIITKSAWSIMFSALLTLIGFFVFNCAYNQINKNNDDEKIIYNSNKLVNISKIFAWGSLIIGSICLFTFFGAFGGIRQALSYAEILRSFNSDLSDYISGVTAILIIPARLVTVAPIMFFLLITEKRTKNRGIYKICFAISMVIAILYYMFNTGRAPLIYFLLCFAIILLYKITNKPWKFVFLIAIISLPILDILDNVSLYFQTGIWKELSINYFRYIYQFTYPFKNILNMVDITEKYGCRFGVDFITSIISLLPGINFPASYENTSIFYNGDNWRIFGGTPNDLLTFAYIEFGILGIPIICCVLGLLAGKLDKIIKIIPDGYIKKFIMSTMAIQFLTIVPNADFISIIRGGFILIVLIIVLTNSYSRRK